MRNRVIGIIALSLLVFSTLPAAADDDPLRRYVEEAISHNLGIEISRSGVDIARNERETAAEAFLPDAGLNYRHTRLSRAVTFDLPFPLPTRSSESTVLSDVWQWQFAVQARVPIYLGGSLRHNLKLKEAAYRGSEYVLSAAERDVALAVIQTYLDLKMALALKEVQTAALESALEHQRAVTAMLEQGMVSMRELKRAEATVAQAESGLIAAENAVQLAKHSFNFLLNRDLEAEIDTSAEPAWSDQYSLEEATERALRSRPELAAMEQRLITGDRQVDLARSSYYPSLSALVEGGFRDGDFQSLQNRDYWQVSIMASFTLFDASRDDRVAAARAARRREELRLESSRKQIELQVTERYIRLASARKQLSAREREKAASEEARRVASLQFEQGMVNQVTYLDAELSFTAARVRTEQSRYQVLKAESALRHAAGYSLP